jgi:signal transduction histidine kinase
MFFDHDGDGTAELLVPRPPDEIWVLNTDLDVQERVRLRHPGIDELHGFADIDGDARDELAVVRGRWTYVISRTGRPLARFEGTVVSELRLRPDERPLLVVSTPGGTIAYRITRNRLWPLYRWGPGGAVVFALLAGTVLLARSAGQRRQLALLRHAQVLATDGGSLGVAVLDRAGSVRWLNPTLERWTAWRRPRFRTAPNVQAFAKQLPALADFCRSALGGTPAAEHARTLVLDLDGEPRECEAHARPFHVNLRGDPHWLLRIEYGRNTQTATTWMLMARSVAHSLKNPLTGVLLTLQRLQMEYRERAPAVANRLDRYTTRIEDGIDELRQLTGNFLKFVNLEAPQFESTDLNGLVGQVAESLRRTLPPDTRLHLRLTPDLAAIEIDRDQIRAVLDNLVSNAVQAMPDGGTVTLSTGAVSGVRWSAEDAPRDFLKLEALDTGVGVPPHLRTRVFEPGFTTREDGTGLGLAIVAKIVGDHGGRVTIEGAVGAGSAFVVHLPIHHNRTATGMPDAGAGRAAG